MRVMNWERRKVIKFTISQITRFFVYSYSVHFIADTVSGGVRNF